MFIKHSKYYFPLPELSYEKIAKKIFQPLILGENSILLCPPLYGRDHAVLQLLARPILRKKILGSSYRRFKFTHFDLANFEFPEAEQVWLKQIIKSLDGNKVKNINFGNISNVLKQIIDNGYELAFLINIPETLSDDYFVKFLELSQRIYYLAPARIHFLLIFDMRWEEKQFLI